MEDNTAVAAAILAELGFCQEEIDQMTGRENPKCQTT